MYGIQTNKYSDECYSQLRELNSSKPIKFITSPFNFATRERSDGFVEGMHIDTEFGVPSKGIDVESDLLNLQKPTVLIDQKRGELQTRMHLTTGKTSSGPLLNDELVQTQSELRNGSIPAHDVCGMPNDVFRLHTILPSNPQIDSNIVMESVDPMWITGGRSSRQDQYLLSKNL